MWTAYSVWGMSVEKNVRVDGFVYIGRGRGKETSVWTSKLVWDAKKTKTKKQKNQTNRKKTRVFVCR